MTDVGQSKALIARELECCVATVDNVRRQFREHDLAGLKPGKSTGRPSRATPAYRKVLRQIVQTPSQELGYGFSVWSVAGRSWRS